MKRSSPRNLRVLSISPSTKGISFAVLEGAERIIDWGIKIVKSDRNPQSLKRVVGLIEQYRPDVVVAENYKSKDSRRGLRAQELLQSILALASKKRIKSRRFSRAQIRKVFARSDATTKYEIAVEIAKRFPEFAPRLPRRRKSWMSEDERMGIFDAVALALTFFSTLRE